MRVGDSWASKSIVDRADDSPERVAGHKSINKPNERADPRHTVAGKERGQQGEMLARVLAPLDDQERSGDKESAAEQTADGDSPGACV